MMSVASAITVLVLAGDGDAGGRSRAAGAALGCRTERSGGLERPARHSEAVLRRPASRGCPRSLHRADTYRDGGRRHCGPCFGGRQLWTGALLAAARPGNSRRGTGDVSRRSFRLAATARDHSRACRAGHGTACRTRSLPSRPGWRCLTSFSAETLSAGIAAIALLLLIAGSAELALGHWSWRPHEARGRRAVASGIPSPSRAVWWRAFDSVEAARIWTPAISE